MNIFKPRDPESFDIEIFQSDSGDRTKWRKRVYNGCRDLRIAMNRDYDSNAHK